MDGWKTILSFCGPAYFQGRTVSFRVEYYQEGILVSGRCENKKYVKPPPGSNTLNKLAKGCQGNNDHNVSLVVVPIIIIFFKDFKKVSKYSNGNLTSGSLDATFQRATSSAKGAEKFPSGKKWHENENPMEKMQVFSYHFGKLDPK